MIFRIISVVTVVSLAAAGAAAGIVAGVSSLGPAQIAACVLGMLALEALLLVGVFERRSSVFGRVFWRGPAGLRAVSLTFDDGPNEPYTSRVLDILRRFDVRATFFLIGENVEAFPDAARRAAAEGHELGNHGWNHDVLPLKTPARIRDQIARTSDAIGNITGTRPVLFRASHGWRNPWVNRVAKEAGCEPVAWTLGVWDTDRPGAGEIVRRAMRGLAGGCVVLLHDGRGTERGTDSSQLVEALPGIIEGGLKAGYRFLTLSEMIREARRA
ncbi:MAG: polysaccharide deacetylase family protein [Candidatus Krumholzibacteriaceae bacterium]|jgi:peptidoglycan/xylan/chitin deacetylase (PgdA/CDA1 family)